MQNLWQFIKFAIVGVSNTLISEMIYCILIFFDVPYLIAYLVGFLLSVLNAYYWSNKYVFVQEEGHRIWWKALLKTYVAYLWGFVVSVILLVVWIDIVQIEKWFVFPARWLQECGWERLDAAFLGEIVAAGINLLITVPMNFLINKYWAYRNEVGKNE